MTERSRTCSIDNPVVEHVEQAEIGSYIMPGAAQDFSAFARASVTPAPRLGQHTEQILSEDLRMSSVEVARLFDRGVVAGPER